MTNESTVEIAVPLPIPPLVVQAAPEVRVKIFNNDEGTLVIECNHELPAIKNVVAQLTRAQINNTRCYTGGHGYRYTLRDVVYKTRDLVTYRDWADAIGAAIMVNLSNAEGAVYESKALQEGAYLAMGNQVYRLSPVAMARQTKALSAVQERAKQKTKVQIEQLMEEAKMVSDALIHSAKVKQEEAEKALLSAHAGSPVPAWIKDRGVVCKYSSYHDRWCAQFKINMVIEGFDIPIYVQDLEKTVTYSWDAASELSVPVTMWVPLLDDGSYQITSVHVDANSPRLPHVDNRGGCMAPGDAPKKIQCLENLQQLASSVKRCMSRVQFDSLYVDAREWMQTFKECMPTDLHDAVSRHVPVSTLALKLYNERGAAAPTETETGDEGSTIWTEA